MTKREKHAGALAALCDKGSSHRRTYGAVPREMLGLVHSWHRASSEARADALAALCVEGSSRWRTRGTRHQGKLDPPYVGAKRRRTDIGLRKYVPVSVVAAYYACDVWFARAPAKYDEKERERLTMSATFDAVSNRVGKSSFETWEFTDCAPL